MVSRGHVTGSSVDGYWKDAETLLPAVCFTASGREGNLFSCGRFLGSVKFRMKTGHFTANCFGCPAISESLVHSRTGDKHGQDFVPKTKGHLQDPQAEKRERRGHESVASGTGTHCQLEG